MVNYFVSYSKKRAFIIFSALNMPESKFNLYKKFDRYGVVSLYFNDNNSWYHNGIENGDDSIEDNVRFIKRYLDENLVEEIVVIGSSMGGYAALLYGTLLNADYIFSFGGEVSLNIKFSRSKLHLTREPVEEYSNITELVSSGVDKGVKYHVFVGSSDVIDLYNTSLLNFDGVNIYVINNIDHFITPYINNIKPIEEIVLSIVSSDVFPNEIAKELTCDNKKERLFKVSKSLYDTYVSIRERRFDEAFDELIKIDAKDAVDIDLYYLLKGMLYSRNIMHIEAKEMLNIAYSINSNNRDICFELAIVSRINGDIDRAISLYNKVADIDESYHSAYYHLAICYELKNNLPMAMMNIVKAMEIKAIGKYATFFDKLASYAKR